jgi:FtsP/CotA-like multicopper oxidase with cupredoxin domain
VAVSIAAASVLLAFPATPGVAERPAPNLRSEVAEGGWNPAAGKPFRQPPTIRRNQDGVLRLTLVCDERTVSVSGDGVRGHVYTGSWGARLTGPTLRIRPGDEMHITFRNRMAHHTNLHVHGLHVSPSGKSDNVFRTVLPNRETGT